MPGFFSSIVCHTEKVQTHPKHLNIFFPRLVRPSIFLLLLTIASKRQKLSPHFSISSCQFQVWFLYPVPSIWPSLYLITVVWFYIIKACDTRVPEKSAICKLKMFFKISTQLQTCRESNLVGKRKERKIASVILVKGLSKEPHLQDPSKSKNGSCLNLGWVGEWEATSFQRANGATLMYLVVQKMKIFNQWNPQTLPGKTEPIQWEIGGPSKVGLHEGFVGSDQHFESHLKPNLQSV